MNLFMTSLLLQKEPTDLANWPHLSAFARKGRFDVRRLADGQHTGMGPPTPSGRSVATAGTAPTGPARSSTKSKMPRSPSASAPALS